MKTDTTATAVRQGWGLPANSLKSHYFIDHRSLCRHWQFRGPLETLPEPPPDACRECQRVLQIQLARHQVPS